MDEHNVFDLSELLREGERTDEPKVDLSGKPKPQGVRVQLNSGVIIKCDCRYTGVNPRDGDRLFTIIAEIDWENYHPIQILVAEMPSDVEFRFRIPGMPDDEANRVARAMRPLLAERIVYV